MSAKSILHEVIRYVYDDFAAYASRVFGDTAAMV